MSNLYKKVAGMSLSGPEIGQVHYIVDSNFRTSAQGWYRSDGTGPGDIYHERERAYVFRTGDHTSDSVCIQAAINAAIDYRGDTAFFTPGSYSLETVLAINCPGLRILGPTVAVPRRAAVIITDAIGDNAISVDDIEVGFIQFVPLTAQNFFAVSTGADNGYFHDFYYNADGIAASTSTEFLNVAATTKAWTIKNFAVHIDAAQGDFLTGATLNRWYLHNGIFEIEGDTWASATTFTGTPIGNWFDLLFFNGSGASSVLTNAFTGAADTMSLMCTRIYINGSLMTTASAIETGFSATGDIDLAECYQTGDATGEGGVVIALA